MKPPRQKVVREAGELLHELGDLLLAHPEMHGPLVDILGEDDAETFLRALINLRYIHLAKIARRKAGRNRLDAALFDRGRRLLAEWPGSTKPYFTRASPTEPGNEFTRWFCARMWPATIGNCRTVLQRIREKKQPI